MIEAGVYDACLFLLCPTIGVSAWVVPCLYSHVPSHSHRLRQQNPSKLIGCCMFSYADKAWMQGTSEGSFGAWTHAAPGPITVTYTAKDFTHWDAPTLGTLNVDQIAKTDLYAAIVKCYKTS